MTVHNTLWMQKNKYKDTGSCYTFSEIFKKTNNPETVLDAHYTKLQHSSIH